MEWNVFLFCIAFFCWIYARFIKADFLGNQCILGNPSYNISGVCENTAHSSCPLLGLCLLSKLREQREYHIVCILHIIYNIFILISLCRYLLRKWSSSIIMLPMVSDSPFSHFEISPGNWTLLHHLCVPQNSLQCDSLLLSFPCTVSE